MDPISQGAIGGAFAQSTGRASSIAKITLVGCLAGMAPDLDIVIQSPTDPLLFLEFHRQFTHSLIFIPLGSLIVAIALFVFVKTSLDFKTTYVASIAGYATHGLLDACTSYGTQLFWPFSSVRVAWNNVSIVDPLFTIPIVILVIVALTTKRKKFSYLAVGWSIFYLALGVIQHERTLEWAQQLAEARGHSPDRLTLKPSFGNLILWKSIYLQDDLYYVDAIRTSWRASWCDGESIDAFDSSRHVPNLEKSSQQAKDIERFRWFSQNYLGYDPENQLVADIRYSMVPSEIRPMWGLKIEPDLPSDAHAFWWTSRDLDEKSMEVFQNMITGSHCTPMNKVLNQPQSNSQDRLEMKETNDQNNIENEK